MTRPLLAALTVTSAATTAGVGAAIALVRLQPCCDPHVATCFAVGMGICTPPFVLGLGWVGANLERARGVG